MDEITSFQVNTHVGELATMSFFKIEKNDIALFYTFFTNSFAIGIIYLGYGALQLFVVNLFINSINETGTINALASCTS